jgi:hypothetical protein
MRTSVLTALSFASSCLAACVARVAYSDLTPVTALAPCESTRADTTGWREANVADLGLQFRYPPMYQRQDLVARHIPGLSEDAWYHDGRPEYVLSVRMVEPLWANTQIREWEQYPEHRECVAAVAARGTPPARVVLHAGGGVLNNYNKEYPPYTVVAEWRFPGGRVVRLVGSGPDSASQREHLAVVQTVHFSHPPLLPAR